MPIRPRTIAVLTLLVVVAAACVAPTIDDAPSTTAATDSTVERPDISDIPDPVAQGVELPSGFRQLLGRDDIFPVYAPTFVPANGVDWAAENLVIGVVLEGEPRAYPVGFLQRREMVIDNHRGIPTLVTW